MLYENAVIRTDGNVMKETVIHEDNPDEEPEVIYKISVNSIKQLTKAAKEIILETDSIMTWNDIYDTLVTPYVSENAEYRLILHDRLFGEMRETTVRVRKEILKSELKNFLSV